MRTAPIHRASLAAIIAMAMPMALASQRAPDLLAQLTVVNGLPKGCSLAAGTRMVGLSHPVEVEFNPWRGNDGPVIASIREVMFGPTQVPDGPPLGAEAFSRFFVRLAEGIDEGYAAFYSHEPAEEVAVYALKFSSNERPANRMKDARADAPSAIRYDKGNTVIVLYGGDGPCSRAIRSHVDSLTR
jgi:hypothetical protein